MAKEDIVRRWLEIAAEDLEVAESNHSNGSEPVFHRANQTIDAMDRRTLTRDEALDTVREYKRVIRSRYHAEPKVVMYGSYAKGHANPDSDIDVAVILPGSEITDHWEQSADLWGDIRKVSVLIEPVLMEDNEDSMLYREVMRTGVAV